MSGISVGIDAGASGTKIVVRRGGNDPSRQVRRFPADRQGEVLDWIHELAPAGIGTTGAGGAEWAERLASTFPVRFLEEFQAWADGARVLLAAAGIELAAPYLVVSVGTGTSAIAVSADGSAERAGGCALGGGTLRGLGQLLLGTSEHDEISTLAARGDRFGIDLEIADLYPDIPRGFTASNFGGRAVIGAEAQQPEDLAHALTVMVGENLSILCASIAGGRGFHDIVFGGGTLRDNPACWASIQKMAQVRGFNPVSLPEGEFAGAEGALLAGEASASDLT
jgi:type II pantothenate kinase